MESFESEETTEHMSVINLEKLRIEKPIVCSIGGTVLCTFVKVLNVYTNFVHTYSMKIYASNTTLVKCRCVGICKNLNQIA